MLRTLNTHVSLSYHKHSNRRIHKLKNYFRTSGSHSSPRAPIYQFDVENYVKALPTTLEWSQTSIFSRGNTRAFTCWVVSCHCGSPQTHTLRTRCYGSGGPFGIVALTNSVFKHNMCTNSNLNDICSFHNFKLSSPVAEAAAQGK